MKKIKNYSIFALVLFLLTFVTSCGTENLPDGASAGTVKDKDGNTYHTVKIGTQIWMVENLKTTKYNDGSAIPVVTDNTAWANLSTGAYCNYNNDVSTGDKYGKLYNWYAVNTGKLAPTGWHVATIDEWLTLEDYVGANLGKSGSISKASSTNTDWTTSTTTGAIGNDLTINNSSGFSALPGGYRMSSNGFFSGIGSYSNWWSFEGIATGLAWNKDSFTDDLSIVGDNTDYEQFGLSVRCVKD